MSRIDAKRFYKGKKEKDFRCIHCKTMVSAFDFGTAHRNHCPMCGYSLHVDNNKGDRASSCMGSMEPVALKDKGKGELCLVHICKKCNKVSYNRIASDDNEMMLLEILAKEPTLDNLTKDLLHKNDVNILTELDENYVRKSLFGNTN